VKLVKIWALAPIAIVACAHAPVANHGDAITLVTLPTESDAHPSIATAATGALERAKVTGVDRTVTSKVSIEVVQLSIECVDPTAACYSAVARSLSAGKLLFAQVDEDAKKPRVTITLYDAANHQPHASKRTFASDADAVAGVANLVSEVTR
jgi:hypothetical protein